MQSRLHIALITLFLGTAIAAPAFASEAQPESGHDAQNSQTEGESTLESIQRYSAEKREQAITEARELMAALDERMARLRTRLDEHWDDMSAAARERTQATLEALEDERAAVADAYERLKKSSASAWEQVKEGFVESYRGIRESFSDAEEEL